MAESLIAAAQHRAHQDMVQGLKSRLQDKKYSDLMVVCNNKILWRVHKIIVCGNCKWFDTYGTGNAIHIKENGVRFMQVLIYYLYNHDYNHSEGSDQLVVHAVLYDFIRHLGVNQLPELITAKFGRALELHYKSNEFLTATKHIFSAAPANEKNGNGLRMAVLKFLTMDGNKKLNELCALPAFKKLLAELPHFNAELTRVAASPTPSLPTPTPSQHLEGGYELVHAEEAADMPKIA